MGALSPDFLLYVGGEPGREIVMTRVFGTAVSACLAMVAVCGLVSAKPAQQTWSGQMRQVEVSAEKSYPITLTFKGGKGYSEYPDLKCGGVWTRIGSVGKQYEIYLEHITHGTEAKEGTGGCIDGVVTLAVKGDKAVLGWFASVEGDPFLASATLSLQAK
jgi:hypothetical protein